MGLKLGLKVVTAGEVRGEVAPRWAWAGGLRGWVALGLTAACLALLALSARLPSLTEAVREASYGPLGFAFLLSALTVVCKGARWRTLYPPAGRPGLGLAVAAVATGQVANWAVPARLGEVVRVGLGAPDAARAAPARGAALGVGVLLAEKLLDGLLLLLAATLLALAGGLPAWLSAAGLAGVGLACAAGVGLALALRAPEPARPALRRAGALLRRHVPARLLGLLGQAEAAAAGMSAWLGPGAAAVAVALTALAWGLGGAVNYLVLESLGLPGGPGAALAVLVALYGGAALPALPGRVGVFQYLCILALASYGVGFDQALVFSIALYAVVYLPPIAVALVAAPLVAARGQRPDGPAGTPGLAGREGQAGPAGRDAAGPGAPPPAPASGLAPAGGPAPEPAYSVIVPAYNAAATLGACLDALLAQSVPLERGEVIVVDDGSTDATATVARRYPVRLLQQPHAGPASARNLGARAARGRLLLFTDADCAPTPTWVEEIVRPLEADPGVAASKGTYRTCQTGLIARLTQVELEEKYAALRRHRSIDFVDTYSAAFRREPFWAAGAFDPAFRVASNEDTQLSYNLAAQGWRLVFAERAVVYHRHSESLRRYLLRKWRHGYWRVWVYRRHPGKVTGDSYTPRSTQLQMLGVALLIALAPLPATRPLALAGGALFLAATMPFVRRALPVGLDVALAVPPVLFLRALALGTGLLAGAAALARTRAG